MAGNLKFLLISAPYEEDSTGAGIIDRRRIYPGTGGGSDRVSKMEINQSNMDGAPTITGFDSQIESVPILRGSDRTFRIKPNRLKVNIPLKGLTAAQALAIHKMWSVSKPVAFHPWYDESTWWMSTFGGFESGAGCAEIGWNGSAMLGRRSLGDYCPSRWSGADGWIVNPPTTELLKRSPGMIGHAAMIESKRTNLVPTSNPTLTGSDAAKITVITTPLSNNALTPGWVLHCITAGAAGGYATIPAITLTAGTRYCASVWAKGVGQLQLKAVHSSTANGTPTDLEPGRWQRVFVEWVQGGTTMTLRVKPNIAGSVCIITAVQVEAEGFYGSYLDPAVTAPTIPDTLHITEAMGRGGDLTIAVWSQRFPLTPTGRRYFFSAYDSGAGAEMYAYVEASTVYLQMMNISTSGAIAGTPFGNWEQWVFVTRGDDTETPGTGKSVQEIWNNGTLLIRSEITAPGAAAYSSYAAGLYVGSDLGLASPQGRAFDSAIDRFRVDLRTWTQQDIEDDYETLRQPAIQALLAQTQGRLFVFSKIPDSFKSGIFTDGMDGVVTLEQISHVPAGLVS